MKARFSSMTGRSATWAAAYLLAAGVLIAVAGAELAGPGPEALARRLERDTARELTSLVETASGVLRAWAREVEVRRDERRDERGAALEAALAAATSWERESGAAAGTAAGLPPLVSDGIAVAILAPSGEKLLEAGGYVDLDASGTLMAPGTDGRTVAVSWADDRELGGEVGAMIQATGDGIERLRETLGPGIRPGAGLYLVAGDGSVTAELSPRPVPAVAAGAPVEAGTVRTVSGDLKTGRLVSARCAVGARELTAVAERFLSAEVLAAGSKGAGGAVALLGLGLVVSLAFAHALYAGLAPKGEQEGPARSSGPRAATDLPRRVMAFPERPSPGRAAAPRASEQTEPEIVPSGESVLRLREALGATGEGPDLAACARSPILRALSRHLRRSGPARLPHEIEEWAARNAVGGPGRGAKAA